MRLPDDFVLINDTNNQTIPLNTFLKLKVSDINIVIAVKYVDDDYDYLKDFRILMYYNGFVLDHQNSSLPLHQLNNRWLIRTMNFQNDNPELFAFFWRVVKYKADAGFLKLWNKLNKKDEESQKIIGLRINSLNSLLYKNYEDDENYDFKINGTKYKGLGGIMFNIDYSCYEEYKRNKNSIWDTLSIICSLSLSFYNVVSVFINFYSQNFDNYKIIERILGNSNFKKVKSKKLYENIDINKHINKKDSLLGKNDESYNISINDEDTDKLDEENNQENNDNYDNIDDEQNKNRNLPKLTFFDYFFNYIYCEKCCKIRKQKIISKCNEIISKYYSIENIVYNQILLENLFKDYKQINKDIMTYENNELIIQLNDLVYDCGKI